MRFRHHFIVMYLLCTFAHHPVANAELLRQGRDQTLPAAAVPAQEQPAVVEADRLEGKKGKQLEASGNALLRKGDQTIRADRLLYFQDTHDIHAQGSVLLRKGDQSIRTDRLWYFEDTREVDAQGSVELEQNGSKMSGPHLRLNLDTGIGTMEEPEFFLPENDGRGAAEVVHIQDKKHFILDKASYTTCPADNQAWMLKMNELEIDKSRQVGIAHHAWIEFKDVPILYSPWMDFPLNDQRKSGFLAPIFGGTVKGGSELTLPYYWNIAANHDATIAPRFMLKRGLMLNNEFRYLEANYGGEVNVDVLPNDLLAKRSRNRFSLKHHQALTDGLNGYINFTRVSDDDYFRDLADTVSATSQANLLREGVLSYQAGDWITSARVQRFQTLQDPVAPIAVPYARLPQLTVYTQQHHSGVNLGFAGEYVDFRHPTAVNGSRAVLNPSISYPMVGDSSLYVTPKLALHSTYYAMGVNNAGALPNASRSLPILSVDSGVAFERESNMFGGDYVQTFEPRAYYVYVPFRDQSALPNFDSAQADFNFTQIFTVNRFSGSDRIGDANQVTVGATSRLLDQKSGAERLKVMMGERFSLKAPQVNLVAPATSTGRSNILLSALGQLTRAWSLDSEFQFDPNQSHTQVFNIAAHFRPEAGKAFNLGYRFLRNTLRQVDVSTQWPLFSRWRGVGRWNYSLQDGRILEVIAGLEYNQSCWSLRFVAQRFATATQQSNIGFFVQLELNDMVKIGSDPLSLLKQSVPGYAKLNGKPTTDP
ncbi:MAG: LPS-assembly protein LptD [Pseudomonadota bacterium]